MTGGFVIPVTVDDLAANGLLGEADPQVCWERSVETLTARKDDIAGSPSPPTSESRPTSFTAERRSETGDRVAPHLSSRTAEPA